MRILFISCLLWTILFTRQVKGESKCLRTNRQPDRMCVTKCDPLTGCRAEEKCLCDGDCGYSCVKRDLSCGRPPRVSNARPQYPATNFSSVVTYVCNEGHTLSGAAKRTCRANGRWDGVGPNCLKMCSLPTIPFSTYIAKPANYTRKYRTGERITLACKKGFEKKPGGNPVRICISGLWTRFPFQCEGTHACKRTIRAPRTKCTQECSPQSGCDSDKYKCLCDGSCGFSCVEIGMSCGNPPSISNGNLVYNNTSYNSTAHYSCNEGYNLNTAPVKRCTAKKRWEGLTPRCLKDCKPPAIPRNANISNPSKKYHSGYKVTFKCNEGYNQEGMATQMCFLGSWTVLPFKCTEGGCGDPGTPENGRKLGVTYSVNSKVYFDCDLGYELEGSADRKCQLNGTWTGIQPVCKVVNCGFPPRPKNGTFIGNETTFRSELEFRCDEGFELQGSAKRMCTTDKSWTGKEVTCNAVDCGSLDPPKNGSLIVKETTYPNHAEIRCDEGFTLLGPRRRTCQANGTWSGNITECKAVDCGALSVPTNGSSIGTETKFPNKIRFRCDTGFDLVGSSVRMCMADKSWNGVKTVCKAVDCGKLPHPTNGSVIGKETTFPNEVEISCDKGFILRGSHRRKCKADRNWSGDTTVCEAINCGKPTLPDHGSVSGVSTRYPHSITFTCIIGYEIYGSVVRRCQANGTWSGSKTTCKPVDCGLLQRPNNGTKVGNKTTFLNEVSFFCNKGFYMLGSSKRTCQADKQWSGVKTFCRAVDCGSLIVPKNGSKLGQETTYPNFIKFSCDEGFILLGSTVRTCLANGSWSGMQTLCQAKDCGPIQAPRNGTKHGSQTTYLNKILFTCNNGFNLIGSNERQCTSDGVWSGAETLCEAKDCGPIRTPINGTKHGTKTTYPSRVTVTCNSGFHLRGSSERECMSDGVWSGVEAYCEAKDCGSLEIPTNGSLVGLTLTTFPNSLTFACDDGFELKGSVVRYCQANALWNGNKTFCQAKDCGPIESPTNGSLFFGDRTTYPHIVLFSCDKGFLLKGSNLRRCTSEGVWSGMPASCEARDCGPLPFLLNGTAIGQRTVYPNEIVFNCDAGFNLVGSRIRRCQSTGIWSGKQTSCQALDCGHIKTPQNGSKFGEETTYPHSIRFSCDEGFILLGSSVRYCLSTGIWSGQQALCQAKDCGPLALPLNGSSFGSDTTFPNVISFYCDVGFIMIGTQTRKCQANGKWSGNETTCRAVECGSLAMPTNGSTYGELTTYPNKVYFNCDEGFVLQGSSIRVCMANGSWSGTETLCEVINCGELAVPQNGTLQGSATTFPNGVDFSCDEGFVLEGSDFRRCQANGTWSGGNTYCRAKDCGKLPFPMNGSVFGSQTTFPNKLQFSCDNGFDLIGSTVRRCEADGMWSGQQTACQAVDCGPLPLLLNGTYLGNLTTYPNEVLSFCDEGFLLRGSARRFCQANRTWSGIQTTCAAVDCGPLPVLINGSSYGSLTYFPNSIQFSCDSGFLLRGSSGRSCLPTGLWSGSNTTCEAIDCGTLAVPVNGSFKGTRTYFPNVLKFSCDEGFILGGATERQCLADGSWSGNDTSCKAVDCGPLLVPRNGSSHGDMTVYPNSVWFSCDAGFFLKGSSRRMCQANGTWSGSLANCNPVECGQVTAPANGSVRGNYTTFPNKLHFYCDDGFILSGSYIRRCTETGTWSGEQTVCIAKDCGLLRTPQNGSMLGTETTFPNVVTFTCDEGFLMDGPNRRRCQYDGTWGGNETICAAIDCGKLKSPKNGSLHGERTVFPESLRFSCDIGFVMGGSPVRQCQPNGTWNGTETTCSAIDCGRPPTPLNGSVYGDKTTYPNIWHFSCDEGFTQHGSTERKCQPNGTWSGKSTFCQANDCGPLAIPINGSSLGKETTFPNKVIFRCDKGFILVGSTIRQCQANTSWSGMVTTCQAIECGFLDAPTNGSSSGDLTVFPNTKYFTCDLGFLMGGSSERACQANGTWSGTNTTCSAVDCGSLSMLMNGSEYGEQTTYPNAFKFECDKGFTLLGSTVRKCQTNGTWSGVEPFCQANDCGNLSVPQNGSLFGSETTFPNVITFSCDDGFILKGSKVRKCQANKTWTGDTTYCDAVDCGSLDSPMNGSFFGNLTVFPNRVRFDCDAGFILSGSSVRTCQSNGIWSGYETKCSAIDCGPLPVPQNGSLFGKMTVYPSILQFSCDEGFTLHGSSYRKCQTNGAWSGNSSFCKANDCGPLSLPMNGTSFGNLTTFPNEISFTCDEGFILHGSVLRQCQANKLWSGNDTFCEAVDCGQLDSPKNGSLSGDSTVFPNSLQFQCDLGFILKGSRIRKCQANGTWHGFKTSCHAIDCGQLQAPHNGSMIGKNTTYPNMLLFTCDVGFTLVGAVVRKCQANGTWSGTDALCQANDCGPLSVPLNGSLTGKLTTYPNKVSFGCDKGFVLRGSAVRQCQPNKQWSGNDTFCEAKDCGVLAIPMNGSLEGSLTTFPNKISFGCDEGFILRGSKVRRCLSNGKWSGNKTFCEAKDCGELVTPTNGSSFGNLTTYPHEKIFTCDEGFILRGSRTRQCLPSGNWSGNTTICVAKDCGPLPVPLNGSLFGEKTTYPNQITFSCDDGFVQRGSVVRRCRSNGTWSGDTTFCKAKECGPLLAPLNGSSSGKLFTFPNIVSFRCDEGFILKGSDVRKCQANGVWTGNDTICEAVDCGVLSSPLNGSSSGNRTVYPNSVRLWCDSGFVLHGSWLRTCQSNGKWDGNETICQAIDCGELMTPQNGTMFGKVTTYPNILRFNCDEGFILTGSSVRKCGSNGTWSGNETNCQAKDCGPLAVPVNGSSIGELTVFPHKVVFNCDEGFLLSGSHIRFCQANGTWSGNQTFCQAVDCGPLSVPANGSSLGAATVFPNSQHFICDPGFILNGSALRTCQPNGTWSGFTTTCSAVDCGRPQPLRNGSVIGENTVYPNFGIHNCDEGFILRGPAKIKCQTNGTWSQTDSFCEAKDCGNLSKPLNGSMTGLETTFPNKVSFNCDEGFILSGSSVRYCQSNGSWSGTETTCTAVDCGSLPAPMNGSSHGVATVFPNGIQFRCEPGFILSGSAERTCQPNRTWSGVTTVCTAVDCGNPQPLQNGSIVGNKTVYPNSVTHRCDEGFILHGSSRITCQTNGTWSKTSSYCEARNCGVLDIPVNGSTTGSKTTYPSKLYFSCDDGFILRGPTIRQCLADGTWSGNDTSCEAVDCGPLLVPVNGSSSGNFTVFPNSVIFKCDPGFNLYGSPTRMCQANGTWSGKAVSCAAKDCGPLAAPTNGSSTGELTFFPNEIAFHCDKGFLLKGSSIRHCQTNGNWSGNQTFCKAVDCGLLSNPMNGSSSGDSTVFPNSVLFDCDSGFILGGSHERKCLANGSWSGFSTVCSAIDCGSLSAPKNGSSTGNLTVFPNSVAFNCDPGFLLNGSATRKCQANGTWSGLQAVCNAIDCGMPQPLQNGTVIGEFTVYPNFVTHVCDEGFVLRGPSKIKCETNGTWSKSFTFCEAKDCGAPVVPMNGSAAGQKTTFPNEVTFSCDGGFILNGSTVRRCQANGSWSGVQTSCRAVDCGPLSAPKNGSFVGDSTVFPNSLLFGCNLGFILDGSYWRTCQANGTWDGLETVCIAKDCGALEIPANGSLHGDLTTFPNKVDFSCDQGFLLRGSQTRRCQGNGTWSGIQTYCEAVDCGPLYVPMNGSASGNSTVFPNSVQFSCDPGFILNGSAVRTCQPHGTWNGTETVCVAVDCGPLPVPTNGSSSGDSTVFPNAIQFSCDPGFILSGSASRMCQTNGTWSGFSTECSAIDCGWPEPLQNGSIIGKFTVYPNSVRHICDMGFVLRGSPEIKCQANGTWSKTSSFCEAKDCGALEVPLNGSITGRETTFPNEAMLSCDVGFILHGSSFRRCQANGTWSGTKTVCKAVDCGSLSAPRNGSSLGNFTVFPNELLFYCDPGFLLGGSSTRTCQANGTWSGIETICTPVDCGPLRPLQYGSYNGTSTVFPNVVNAVCDMGFILRGSSRIKCQVNGTWSSNDTFCDAKDCGNLPRPLNGSVIGGKTTYPSEVEFECDAGFNLQGSTIRRCEADGQWSGVEVKCRAVDCGRLAIPEHGFAHGNSTTYPNTITFSCNTGFSLHGTSSRTCQADGTWTSGKTRCQGEDCGKLLPPDNGWMYGSDTSHPSEVLFRCGPGYSMVGSSQRTCLRNGSWSGQPPRCLPRWCSQAPDVPAFAYQTWTAKNKRYEDGDRIYYSCKAGLMMVGIPMRKCVKGRWTKANFRCSAPSCDAPPVPKFAYLTWARGARSKYLNGETAYYSCQAGYELIGIPYIECKDSGWTKIDFSCKAVDCGFLESPPNGGIAKKTGKTFGAIYVFECDEDKGYLMDGSKERRCQADATWSGVQPVCKLQSCVTPSKPMHGKFKSEPRSKYYFENIVGYQCDSGYSLRGHERTKCLIHGNWSHAAPTCTRCSKPLGLKSRMIFSRQLSASSERDSRHSARHGRLDGNSAWCSARSSFAKYFQIDFGRTVEVTSVATQGHPSEEKWIQRYILRYSLGKNWFTYQASGRDKVFKGNRDGRSAVRHYLKERLVAKKLRIVRHENSRDFMGSTVCLRAEVYGCSFDTECLTFGSEVFAHWNSIKKHTRYIHGYVTKVRRTSVHISPSGKHGGNADSIFELPREKEFYVIKDEKSSPQEIKIGSDVIVASKDKVGFSQGKVTQKYYSWYGVELGNGKTVWGTVDEIRLLKRPIYCEKEYITA